MSSEPERSTLRFDGRPVALLSDIFDHQGTWFAAYHLAPDLSGELLAFIQFNRDHLSTGEFDEEKLSCFKRFYETDLWTVQRSKGEEKIEGAPLFLETELSWVV